MTATSSPYRNVERLTGGVPAAMTPSRRPQRLSWSTPPRSSAWVESGSELASPRSIKTVRQTAAGQQHRSCSAGRSCADHDDIV